MDYSQIMHKITLLMHESMDYPWTLNGLTMAYPKVIHGGPRDSPWIVCGSSMDNPWSLQQRNVQNRVKQQIPVCARVYPCVFYSVCIFNAYFGSPCVFPCVSVCIFGSPCVIPCASCAVCICAVCIFNLHSKRHGSGYQNLHAKACRACLQIY